MTSQNSGYDYSWDFRVTDRIPHADQSNRGFQKQLHNPDSGAKVDAQEVFAAQPAYLPLSSSSRDHCHACSDVRMRWHSRSRSYNALLKWSGSGTAAAFSSTSSRPFRRSTALRRSLWPNHPAFLATGIFAQGTEAVQSSARLSARGLQRGFKTDLHPLPVRAVLLGVAVQQRPPSRRIQALLPLGIHGGHPGLFLADPI